MDPGPSRGEHLQCLRKRRSGTSRLAVAVTPPACRLCVPYLVSSRPMLRRACLSKSLTVVYDKGVSFVLRICFQYKFFPCISQKIYSSEVDGIPAASKYLNMCTTGSRSVFVLANITVCPSRYMSVLLDTIKPTYV